MNQLTTELTPIFTSNIEGSITIVFTNTIMNELRVEKNNLIIDNCILAPAEFGPINERTLNVSVSIGDIITASSSINDNVFYSITTNN
jgi:hypothetical protein